MTIDLIRRWMAGAAMAVTSMSGAAEPPHFTPLGWFPGGYTSEAFGVSGDGRVVVGWCYNASSQHEAFRWTAATGMVGMGFLPGGGISPVSIARGVNADGTVIVGHSYQQALQAYLAFRWTLSTGMVGLGDLPGGFTQSQAYATTADGAVVVGNSSSGLGVEAFRLILGQGMQGLGALPGGQFDSRAQAVNGNGSVVVGYSEPFSGQRRAFRWLQGAGMMNLGVFAGGNFSEAKGVSADGTVVVGRSDSTAGFRAFRWTVGAGMQDLGALNGATGCGAYAVSPDGQTVVGSCTGTGLLRGFLWTQATGMMDLQEHLLSLGLTGAAGWDFRFVNAISADGRTLVGSGFPPSGGWEQAWIAHLGDTCYPDCNGDGALNLADFGCFQTKFALLDPYADCNGDGALNLADFGCFQTKFALGCP